MMLWFALLLGLHWLGLTPENLSQETVSKVLEIIQMGVGAYIVGRTGEKMIKTYKGDQHD